MLAGRLLTCYAGGRCKAAESLVTNIKLWGEKGLLCLKLVKSCIYLELFFLFILWKTLFRVFENSPNRCPTISWSIFEGIKVFPLCTRNSFPTSLGSIIDRRDQTGVFDKCLFPFFCVFCISEKKPFHTERAIPFSFFFFNSCSNQIFFSLFIIYHNLQSRPLWLVKRWGNTDHQQSRLKASLLTS